MAELRFDGRVALVGTVRDYFAMAQRDPGYSMPVSVVGQLGGFRISG